MFAHYYLYFFYYLLTYAAQISELSWNTPACKRKKEKQRTNKNSIYIKFVCWAGTVVINVFGLKRRKRKENSNAQVLDCVTRVKINILFKISWVTSWLSLIRKKISSILALPRSFSRDNELLRERERDKY